MSDLDKNQHILAAIERVEHPAIATTLIDLGIVKDLEISPDGKVALSLALPFANVPDAIRDYMINSLAAAAQAEGGELGEVKLMLMSPEDVQTFLAKEQQHWRG